MTDTEEPISRLEAAKRALRDACIPWPEFERCLNEVVRAARSDLRKSMRAGKPKGSQVESMPAGCGHRFFEPECVGCRGRQPQVARGGRR